MRTLDQLVRPNVREMAPYSCARNEFHGDASVFLDANENPYNSAYNRYPDPLQWKLKERIAELKGVDVNSIFLGNGSDEAIDLPMRIFCEPQSDNIVSMWPSYGMYETAAAMNNIAFKKVELNESFEIDANRILDAVDKHTKLIFLCSPNNPTGNCLNPDAIIQIIKSFDGIVILDEAYGDFSSAPSFLQRLKQFSNLIVLQTMSKAWGAAGIRLGMAFASPEIIALYNKVKYPYNINILTQERALELLNNSGKMKEQLASILAERTRLKRQLTEFSFVKKIYPTDANFLLVNVGAADLIYDYLMNKGVIVRNRNSVSLCLGCLRITVGTPTDNDSLINALKQYKS